MKIKKYQNHISVKFGGVNGEKYMFRICFHNTKPYIRICICFNTDKLIKAFGYNQKDIALFN